MSQPLDDVRAASLPAASVAALAGLRDRPGIAVLVAGDRAWVRWGGGDESALERLLAVQGVALFDLRDGVWYPHGSRLPASGVPLDSAGFLPIARALIPVPIRPVMPGPVTPAPLRLTLVRDGEARPASALRCTLDELGRWSETATTRRLRALSAARSGSTLLVVGKALPPIAGGERFWGDRALVPLGFRPEPCLRELALLAALGVPNDHRLLIDSAGSEAVPMDAFRPLTRAGLRLACEEAAP
jgi:hypothetical protein